MEMESIALPYVVLKTPTHPSIHTTWSVQNSLSVSVSVAESQEISFLRISQDDANAFTHQFKHLSRNK